MQMCEYCLRVRCLDRTDVLYVCRVVFLESTRDSDSDQDIVVTPVKFVSYPSYSRAAFH